jgi:hypothetical protein
MSFDALCAEDLAKLDNPQRAGAPSGQNSNPYLPSHTTTQNVQDYEDMIRSILEPDDYCVVASRETLKRKGWRRVGLVTQMSYDIKSIEIKYSENDTCATIVVRATLPSGRYAEACGSCSRSEPGHGGQSIHVLQAIAETRAKNRAIEDLAALRVKKPRTR